MGKGQHLFHAKTAQAKCLQWVYIITIKHVYKIEYIGE